MLIIGRELFIGTENTPGLMTVQVVPEAVRCMQCGICSFNCPAGIDVRDYAWQGLPVDDSACLACGQCILRCPRRALHFEPVKFT